MDHPPARVKQAKGPATGVTVAALVVAVALALILAPHYGQGWDDPGDARYGQASLRAYLGSTDFLNHGDRVYYGPFFYMISSVIESTARRIAPGLHPVDVRHVLSFLSFVLGLLAFHSLSRRLMKPWAAASATLLLASQPMLFGHAFINGKDIPFLALFLLAVSTGLKASDGLPQGGSSTGPSSWGSWLAGAWRLLWSRPRWKLAVGLAVTVATAAAVGMIWSLPWSLRVIESTLRHAYQGTAWGPINAAFHAIAQDAYKTPVEAYIAKARMIYLLARVPAGTVILALGAAGSACVLGTPCPVGSWLRDPCLRSAALGGAILGLSVSVRVAGVSAAFLVIIYWWIIGLRSPRTLVAYAGTASVITYLTWPWLWESPLTRLWRSLAVMSSFEPRETLFDGRVLLSTEIPWDYFPRLLSLQLTEPVLLLALVGLAVGLARLRSASRDRAVQVLLLLWFALPFAATALLRTPLYDNGRQLLFILPPLFVWSGLALQSLLHRLPQRILQVGAVCLLLAPGLSGILRLHPYEYIYYNQLTGGVAGAAGRYELDYWCTSYRELMTKINAVAPLNSSVSVWGPVAPASNFARADIRLRGGDGAAEAEFNLTCRLSIPSGHVPDGESVLFQVERAGGVTALVRSGAP